MAVKIRLRRMGRKKRPIYGVVAADIRSPRDGRYIEDLGRYNPIAEPAKVSLNGERVLYWLSQGAQPTRTVQNLLRKDGLLLAFEMQKKGATAEEIEAAVADLRAAEAEKGANKTTVKQRKQAALEAEAKDAAAKEAEQARIRAEAEAAARAAAEEARRKAEEERQKQQEEAAAQAKAEQEAANAAQEAADAEAPAEAEPAADEAAPADEKPAA